MTLDCCHSGSCVDVAREFAEKEDNQQLMGLNNSYTVPNAFLTLNICTSCTRDQKSYSNGIGLGSIWTRTFANKDNAMKELITDNKNVQHPMNYTLKFKH